MKKALIVALLGLAFLAQPTFAAPPAPWQYLVVIQTGDGFTGKNLKLPDSVKSVPDMLNHFGKDNWELVTVTTGTETRYFFKRPGQ